MCVCVLRSSLLKIPQNKPTQIHHRNLVIPCTVLPSALELLLLMMMMMMLLLLMLLLLQEKLLDTITRSAAFDDDDAAAAAADVVRAHLRKHMNLNADKVMLKAPVMCDV